MISISLILTAFLWLVVAALASLAAKRGVLREGASNGIMEFLRIMPRIAIGMIGSGYIAALLPQEFVSQWLGPGSGILSVMMVTALGALTPGGPVIGFSIGAAAIKGGAGVPQVIAYSTAWALFAFPRLLAFELPMMPTRVVWLRVLVSLPIPLLAAGIAALLGKP
jgi:hypothetical protein